MKNLSNFKAELKKAFLAQTPIKVEALYTTTFLEGHPLREKYEQGMQVDSRTRETKVARVQTNAFTTWMQDSKGELVESWMQFGAASSWTFSEGNKATYLEVSKAGDVISTVKLTYIL